MVSRNLERANENDRFKMTALETALIEPSTQIQQVKYKQTMHYFLGKYIAHEHFIVKCAQLSMRVIGLNFQMTGLER